MIQQPFQPKYGSNQTLTPSAASATVVIDADKNCKQVRIVNRGASVCYVRIGESTLGAASVADCAIAPNMATTLTKFMQHTHMSYISAGGTTLDVMVGDGH